MNDYQAGTPSPEEVQAMEAIAEQSDEDFFIALGKLVQQWYETNKPA